MSLTGLLGVISADTELGNALEHAALRAAGGGDLIAPPALRPVLAAALAGDDAEQRFVLAVTATAREAEDLTAALGSLLPPESVGYFPAWETLPHERLSPRSDTSGQRLAVLRRLAHPDPADLRTGPLRAVVTPVRSLLQPMPAGLGDLEPVSLAPGQEADLEEVVSRLVEIGYARAELVEKRGELAVRGGILDVFPPTEEHPLRVDFFGDEVEEIRYFKVADQRSLEVAAGRPVGAAMPGTAADAGGAVPGQGAGRRVARAGRGAQQAGGRHHRGGHGGVRPHPVRPDGTAARLHPGRRHRGGLRPGADPGPRGRPGRHQPGVPGGVVGQCGGRRAGSGGPGRSSLPGHHRHPVLGGGPRHPVVDDHAVRGRGRARGRRRRDAARPTEGHRSG